MQPLDGIKVVDLTHAVAGPYSTMLLGCMGADVIKVEALEGGDLSRPLMDAAYFVAFNLNKRSITLNLRRNEGKEILSKLVKTADVFVESFRPGVVDKLGFGYETVNKLNPSIIYCSISGFGQSGPYKYYPAFDAVVQAMCGLMMMTGNADGPPVRVGAPIIDLGTGMLAAYSIMLCLFLREKTGRGQQVDVSLFDTAASWMSNWMAYYTLTGKVPKRTGSGAELVAPYQVFETRDKPIFLGVVNDKLWTDLCQVLRLEDLKTDPRFFTNDGRWANREELVNRLTKIFKKYKRNDLVKKLVKIVPCGPVKSIDELTADPQLQSRGVIVDTVRSDGKKAKVAGIPTMLSETPGKIRRLPPRLGEHTDNILKELKYSKEKILKLKRKGVT